MIRTLCIAGALCVAQLAAAAQAPTLPDAEVTARVQQVIERAISRPEAVGLSVAVGRGDRLIVERGAGVANLEFDAPTNAATMFRIGSITKQFTAAGIMKLVERGKLGLDDELSKYVPTFDTGGRKVTLRQLLNHASGIPNYTAQAAASNVGQVRDLTHQQLLAVVKGVPFDFEPGQGWKYSNTNYYLLGMVIEVADGRPYARFLQEEFFTPLGLTRIRYGSESEIFRNRAQGYATDSVTGERINDMPINMLAPGAAGGLAASAGDLVRWQMALTGGRAVSAESYKMMVESSVPAGGARYGFGLNIEEAGGGRRISHNGAIAGFNSMLIHLPASGLHVAVISNSESLPSVAVANLIVQALGSATAPVTRTTPASGSEAAVRRLIGEIVRGEPDYARMGAGLAATTRQQLPALQNTLKGLGEVRSVTFSDVGLAGLDRFDVKFASGALRISILLDAEGRVVSLGMQPAGR